MQNLPPLPWLRAFESAARHLSFTQAAQELLLTQAAISKQVKLLEHHLREPLFQRKPRSLLLTKAGAAYLPKVQDAFDRLATGTEEVFGNRRTEILTIRVAVGFAVNWLAPRLPAFFSDHPDIPLRIISSVWNEEQGAESCDLDIRYCTGRWPASRVDRLSWEALTPLCTLAIAASLRHPNDLARHRLLHVLGYQQGWATWLAAAGATDVAAGSGAQFDTSLMALAVAEAGGGIALGRTSLAKASPHLTRPFALAVPVEEAFYLLSPTTTPPHPHAAPFRAWLLTQIPTHP